MTETRAAELNQEIHSVRLTIRAGQVCELGAFSTPNQAFWFVSCGGD